MSNIHIPPPRPHWAEQEVRTRPSGLEQAMADHHVGSLSFVRNALGAPPTLTDALIALCDAWPDEAEAESLRKVIVVHDYMTARDQIAQEIAR